jgi:4a-hydroxytetrahydrobiopterin dehydratase
MFGSSEFGLWETGGNGIRFLEKEQRMTLTTERCEVCRADSPRVTADEERELKPQIPDWEIIEVDDVQRLRRTFKFKGWLLAVQFADAVAALAEAENHHPTILIEWGKVTVTWWTHAIKGLHRNDFIMAARTDQEFDNRSTSGVPAAS